MTDLWVERADAIAGKAEAWRDAHGIALAESDQPRVAAFGIDCQVSFCHPNGGLFVPGAVEDSRRALTWMYRNLDRLTNTVWSLDTHEVYQVFHAAFWRDREGRRPAPFTTITAEQIRSGHWLPRAPVEVCVEYAQKLEATGKHVLTIWPYHGLLGGLGHALLPAFAEAMTFHAHARGSAPRIVVKGRHPLTEMYSVMAPEVTELAGEVTGRFDEGLYAHLRRFDRVYVFGQASSHCVLATLEDLRDRALRDGPDELARFVILEDAMSPVSPPPLEPLPPELDFPRMARERIGRLVDAGMGRARTGDPIPP